MDELHYENFYHTTNSVQQREKLIKGKGKNRMACSRPKDLRGMMIHMV
jgi:hypothetical protein